MWCDASTWTVLESATSTNDVVKQAALEGSNEGYAVLAKTQSKGRGRQGREWQSRPGLGLYLSVLLRPDWSAGDAGWLALLAGVSVAGVLRELGMKGVVLKWPNDVLIEGRKICGILVEPELYGGKIRFAVIGIGINVGHIREDWTGDVQDRATSCRLEGVDIDVLRLARMVLENLEHWYTTVQNKGLEAITEGWTGGSVTRGAPEVRP